MGTIIVRPLQNFALRNGHRELNGISAQRRGFVCRRMLIGFGHAGLFQHRGPGAPDGLRQFPVDGDIRALHRYEPWGNIPPSPSPTRRPPEIVPRLQKGDLETSRPPPRVVRAIHRNRPLAAKFREENSAPAVRICNTEFFVDSIKIGFVEIQRPGRDEKNRP